jgi:membrane fusion protein (multidrug efflux system)
MPRSTVLACAMAVLFLACSGSGEAVPRERPVTCVEVEPVALGNISDRIELPAEVRPIEETRLAAGTGGKVDAVYVDVGDSVAKGQILGRVAADLAAAQLKQAETQLAATRASSERTAQLSAKGLASAAERDRAAAALAQAEAAVEMSRVRLADAVVRAPHAGKVAKRYISRGEHAVPGAPLFDVVDISTVEAVAQLPERDAPRIEAGRTATLTADAWPGETFTGTVHHLGVVADKHSRTFELVIRVANQDGGLRPGMLARVRLVRQQLSGVPVVRGDAVVEGADNRAVFVVRDGRAVRTPVTLGAMDGDSVAVLEGVRPGDAVVVVGQRTLTNGEQVRIVDPDREPVPMAGSPAAPSSLGGSR